MIHAMIVQFQAVRGVANQREGIGASVNYLTGSLNFLRRKNNLRKDFLSIHTVVSMS